MKEICNQIAVFLKNDVLQVTADNILPKEGKTGQTIYTDDFHLETNMSNTSASILNSITKKLYADKLPTEVEKQFASPRSVIIKCITGRNSAVILGSLEFPAKMTISPAVNKDIIHLSWKTPSQIPM